MVWTRSWGSMYRRQNCTACYVIFKWWGIRQTEAGCSSAYLVYILDHDALTRKPPLATHALDHLHRGKWKCPFSSSVFWTTRETACRSRKIWSWPPILQTSYPFSEAVLIGHKTPELSRNNVGRTRKHPINPAIERDAAKLCDSVQVLKRNVIYPTIPPQSCF